MATKPRGWGANGLSGRATKIIIFFAASLNQKLKCYLIGFRCVREAAKKVFFLVYSPLRPYLAPLPFGLVVKRTLRILL